MPESGFIGFSNPVDPTPEELRAWAYHPASIPVDTMPADWDLLLAGDTLAPTLFELALDRDCPARRFALHCMYIYAAESLRSKAGGQRRRRLRKYVERAGAGDEAMQIWAHNCRTLMTWPELFSYDDWCEGGLVRHPRRLSPYER